MNACVRFLNAMDPSRAGLRMLWRGPDTLRLGGGLPGHAIDINLLNGWVARVVVGTTTSIVVKIPDTSSDEFIKRLAQECHIYLDTP